MKFQLKRWFRHKITIENCDSAQQAKNLFNKHIKDGTRIKGATILKYDDFNKQFFFYETLK